MGLQKILDELTSELREVTGRDDLYVAYDVRPILECEPCLNCGAPSTEHVLEEPFGLVCPTDAAARTDDERFTYTRPEETP